MTSHSEQMNHGNYWKPHSQISRLKNYVFKKLADERGSLDLWLPSKSLYYSIFIFCVCELCFLHVCACIRGHVRPGVNAVCLPLSRFSTLVFTVSMNLEMFLLDWLSREPRNPCLCPSPCLAVGIRCTPLCLEFMSGRNLNSAPQAWDTSTFSHEPSPQARLQHFKWTREPNITPRSI